MKNKYDRIGYWPTDMGVTEDEYKRLIEEQKKTGGQRFVEDYWAVLLLVIGVPLITALVLTFLHPL